MLLFPWTNAKTLLFIVAMLIQISDEGVPSGLPLPIIMLILLLITYSLPLYFPISYWACHMSTPPASPQRVMDQGRGTPGPCFSLWDFNPALLHCTSLSVLGRLGSQLHFSQSLKSRL